MGESPKDISDLSPAQRELLLRRVEEYVKTKRAGAVRLPQQPQGPTARWDGPEDFDPVRGEPFEGRGARAEGSTAPEPGRAESIDARPGEHAAVEARGARGRALPSSLVELQPMGRGRPFFCVHARRGGVSSYYHLARHLGADRPFFGVQAAGLDGEAEPHARVEDMAAHYLDAVRAVQSEGPYALGGWSFGGLIALEMAQQLAARGAEVAPLVLIDTYAHSPDGLTEMDTTEILSELLTGTFDIPAARLAEFKLDGDIDELWEALKAAGATPAHVGGRWFRGYVNVSRANHEALLSYAQRPYPGRVVLVQAEEGRDVTLAEQRERWEAMTAGVDARSVPCSHNDLVNEPHVRILAGHLRQCLEAAG